MANIGAIGEKAGDVSHRQSDPSSTVRSRHGVHCDEPDFVSGHVVNCKESHRSSSGIDCSEALGLMKFLKRGSEGSDSNVWECANYTGYSDSRGRLVGGNCNPGTGGVISQDGRLLCACPPVVDPVTGKRYVLHQLDIKGVQLCVMNRDLYEVD